MSDILIDAVKQLADLEPILIELSRMDGYTNGPTWEVKKGERSGVVIKKIPCDDGSVCEMTICQTTMSYDADIIAAARNAVPVLLELLNAAPKLLDVLSQIHAGDAAQIATIMRQMQSWYGEDKTPGYEERMKLLARMQNMASLMESHAP